MRKEKLFNIRFLAVVSAFVLLIVSLTCYGSFDAGAALSQRTYLRYDCENLDKAPYEYGISVPETVFSNGMQPYSIIGSNDMVRDYDTAVVSLSGGGAGFIIDAHTIVTAGHCVYDIDKDKFISNTIDIVGSDNKVIKTISPHYVHVPKKFVDSASDLHNYDYALIYVDEDLSEYGQFNMGICLDSYVTNNGKVTVSGFPINEKYPTGYEDSGYGLRFKATGNILDSENDGKNITYNADTAGGDSGGPVYVNESCVNGEMTYDYNTVIAINVAENEGQKKNKGVRINFDILWFCYQNKRLTD